MKQHRAIDHSNLTKHAQARARQRGVRETAVRLAIEFGEWFYAGNGCDAAYLSRNAVRAARRRHGVRLDQFQNLAVILSSECAVVTVQHVERPIRHWRGAR